MSTINSILKQFSEFDEPLIEYLTSLLEDHLEIQGHNNNQSVQKILLDTFDNYDIENTDTLCESLINKFKEADIFKNITPTHANATPHTNISTISTDKSITSLSQAVKNISQMNVGTKVQALYEHDNGWYDAVIEDILPNDKYIVEFIEYGNREEVNAAMIRIPNQKVHGQFANSNSSINVGTQVVALYTDDGKWYDAIIDSILPNGNYVVRFCGYDTLQEVGMSGIQLPKKITNALVTPILISDFGKNNKYEAKKIEKAKKIEETKKIEMEKKKKIKEKKNKKLNKRGKKKNKHNKQILNKKR